MSSAIQPSPGTPNISGYIVVPLLNKTSLVLWAGVLFGGRGRR